MIENEVAEGKAKVVWRHFAALGPDSTLAAQASDCAAEQEQFWPYHDRLFAAQGPRNGGAFSVNNLKRYAAEAGLDAAAFGRCLDSGRTRGGVERETRTGQQQGISGVPTVFINGVKLDGVPRYEQIREQIARLAGAVPAPTAKP